MMMMMITVGDLSRLAYFFALWPCRKSFEKATSLCRQLPSSNKNTVREDGSIDVNGLLSSRRPQSVTTTARPAWNSRRYIKSWLWFPLVRCSSTALREIALGLMAPHIQTTQSYKECLSRRPQVFINWFITVLLHFFPFFCAAKLVVFIVVIVVGGLVNYSRDSWTNRRKFLGSSGLSLIDAWKTNMTLSGNVFKKQRSVSARAFVYWWPALSL